MRRHPSRRAVLASVLMAAAAAIVAFDATTALAGRPIDQQYGPPLGGSDKTGHRHDKAHWLSYTIVDLGTLGGDSSQANAINERGQAVGCASLSGSSCGHAFVYSRGKLIDIGTLPEESNASAINERGQVVGVSGLAGNNIGLPFGHAFRYTHGPDDGPRHARR